MEVLLKTSVVPFSQSRDFAAARQPQIGNRPEEMLKIHANEGRTDVSLSASEPGALVARL